MTLLFMDSFDHYNSTTDMAKKWTTIGLPVSFTTGRFNNGILTSANYGAGADNKISLTTSSNTIIIGIAVKFGSNGFPTSIFEIDGGGGVQSAVMFSYGVVRACRGQNWADPYFTVSSTLQQNVWYYFEYKLTVGSSGSAELRINGDTVGTYSGNTMPSSTGSLISAFAIRASYNYNSTSFYYDDLYICDGEGTNNNNFLGDCKVQTLNPNGNSSIANQWTGSDGDSTNNYLLVDETYPDTTDYVQTNTQTNKDLYTFTNSNSTGTVYGVQILSYAAKIDSGTRKIANIANLSGTETTGSDKNLSLTPLYYAEIMETKPGGNSWTTTDIDNAEFGVKLTV